MSKQEVILCESLETSLSRAIEQCPHDKLFILTDEHTRRLRRGGRARRLFSTGDYVRRLRMHGSAGGGTLAVASRGDMTSAVRVQGFTVGPLQENCWLLSEPASRAAVLVDPGDEAERLLAAVADSGCVLQAIWLTHAHFDHLGAVAAILRACDACTRLSFSPAVSSTAG